MHVILYLCEVLFRINRDSRGAVSAEYAFLITFIAIAAAIGMVTLGDSLANYFITFGNTLSAAGDAVDATSAS